MTLRQRGTAVPMHTIDPQTSAAGFAPDPLTTRVFVRCYRHYGDAKRGYDQLRVVAGIPDKRMTVVARGLEWQETLPVGTLYRMACGLASLVGSVSGLVLWALGFTGSSTSWLTQTVLAGIAGVAVGFVIATAVAWLRKDRSGKAETGHVTPKQYDILVEEDFAETARQTLADR